MLLLVLMPKGFATKGPHWLYVLNHYIGFEEKQSELLLEKSPGAKALILILRDLHITKIEIKWQQVEYFQNHSSERTWSRDSAEKILSRGHEDNIEFMYEWTVKNEESILKLNEKYVMLRIREAELFIKQKNHLQWPLMRETISTIRNTKKYKDLRRYYDLDGYYGSPVIEDYIDDAAGN